MPAPPPTGWKLQMWHWHFFEQGDSLCGKFNVIIVGGGAPRKPFPAVIPAGDGRPVCPLCQSRFAER